MKGKKKKRNPPQSRKSQFGSFLPQNSPPAPVWVQKAPFPSIPAAGFWSFGFSLRIWGSRGTGGAAGPEPRRDLGQKRPELGKSQRETASPTSPNQYGPVWDGGAEFGVNTANGGGQNSQNSRGTPKFHRGDPKIPKFPGKILKFPRAGPKSGGWGPQNWGISPKIPKGTTRTRPWLGGEGELRGNGEKWGKNGGKMGEN